MVWTQDDAENQILELQKQMAGAQQLQSSFGYGLGQNPQKAALANRVSRVLGVNPTDVGVDPERYANQARLAGFDFPGHVEMYPTTSHIMSDPNAAAASLPDLEHYQKLESTFNNKVQEGALKGLTTSQVEAIRNDFLNTQLWNDSRAGGSVLSAINSSLASLTNGFYEPYTAIAKNISEGLGVKGYADPIADWVNAQSQSNIKRQVSGTLTDPTTGKSFKNPLAGISIQGGVDKLAGMAGALGMMALGGEIAAPVLAMNAAFDQYRNAVAKGLSPWSAAGAGFTAGAANLALLKFMPHPVSNEAFFGTKAFGAARKAMADTVGEVDNSIVGDGFKMLGEKSAGRPGFYTPIADQMAGTSARELAGSVLKNTARAVPLAGGMTLIDNTLRQLYEPDGDYTKDFGKQLVTFGLFENVGLVQDVLQNSYDAYQRSQFLTKVREAVEATKIAKTDPLAFKDHLQQLSKGAEVSMPEEAFTRYWQAQGMDPADVADKMGVTNYADALKLRTESGVAAGTDLQIPVAGFIAETADTPHFDALAPDVRLRPGVATLNEAEANARQLTEQIQKNLDLINSMFTDKDVEHPDRDLILAQSEALFRQLGGPTAEAAPEAARIFTNGVLNLAREASRDPKAIAQTLGADLRSGRSFLDFGAAPDESGAQPDTKQPGESPEAARIRQEAEALFAKPETDAAYNNHLDSKGNNDTMGGAKLNVDIARKLDPNFVQSPTATVPHHHEAVSEFIKRKFSLRMAQPVLGPNETVVFLAGGGGSGKGSVEKRFKLGEGAHTIVDGTMKSFKSAKAMIDEALDVIHNGDNLREVVIDFILRDVPKAVNGTIARGHGTGEDAGRFVGLDQLTMAHEQVPHTILQLMEAYKDNPYVHFKAYENNGNQSDVREIPDGEVQQFIQDHVANRPDVATSVLQTYNQIRENGYEGYNGERQPLAEHAREFLDRSLESANQAPALDTGAVSSPRGGDSGGTEGEPGGAGHQVAEGYKAQADEVAPGASEGVVVDTKTGEPVFNVEDAARGIAENSSKMTLQQGVTTPVSSRVFDVGGELQMHGRFLRGTNKTVGNAHEVVAQHLIATNMPLQGFDQVGSTQEALDWGQNSVYLSPTVVDFKQPLRYKATKEGADQGPGFYGNEKMAFGNAAYPHGRNTFDIPGCGREAWAVANGLNLKSACYGGACYAETLKQGKQGKSSGVAKGIDKKSVQGPERTALIEQLGKEGFEATQKAAAKQNIEAVKLNISARQAAEEAGPTVWQENGKWYKATFGYYTRPDKSRMALRDVAVGAGVPAVVSANLGKAKGQDVRLGVDTDGAAWLSDPRVLDSIVATGLRSLSLYSSAYHEPPPPHELADRTIINVTISGWHPLPETMSRLRWAEEARKNGWNVILREVLADPAAFGEGTSKVYNRLHDALLKTDFFIMQQPLHMGSETGAELFGLPGCCKGSEKNPRTCDQCEVSEGLGKRFQEYWGIADENRPEEKVLPGVPDFKGRQLPNVTAPDGGVQLSLRQPVAEAPTQATTPEFQKWFGDSTVKNEDGSPKPLFHASTADFEEPRTSTSEMGFHVGSADQANALAENQLNGDSVNVKKVFVRLEHPLRIKDMGEFTPQNVYRELVTNKIISDPYIHDTMGDLDYMGDEKATKFVQDKIKEAGYDGLVYKNDHEGGADSYIVFDANQVKSATGNDGQFSNDSNSILHQPSSEGARGAIDFLNNGKKVISVSSDADKSTIFHELGHFFIQTIHELAQETDATDNIKKLSGDIHKWLGVADGEQIPEDKHEVAAVSFLKYLEEGKAPSPALAGTFDKVARWFGKIGRQLLSADISQSTRPDKYEPLGFRLNPEVRGIFERLVAAEDATTDAAKQVDIRPLFASAADMGVTEAEFSNYQRMLADQTAKAHEAILAKLTKEAARRQTESYKEQRTRVESEVRAQLAELPEYRSLKALVEGKILDEDGGETPIKLSKQSLVDEYGQDSLNGLARGMQRVYTDNGGMDADAAATILRAHGVDIADGEDLIKKLTGLEKLGDRAKRETDDRMQKEHPDLMKNPEQLRTEAIEEMHNEKREEVLAEDLRALNRLREKVRNPILNAENRQDTKSRNSAKETLPDMRAARLAAAAFVGTTPVFRTNPDQYLKAEQKAGRKAFDLQGKGDYDGAASAKREEILNHFMYLEAVKAKQFAQKARDFAVGLSKPKAQGILGKAGSDYLEQVNNILNRFEYSNNPTKATMAARESLAEWVQKQVDRDEETVVPDWLMNEALTKNYRQLTNNELEDVHNALTNIDHLARRQLGVTIRGQKMEFQELVSNLDNEARSNNTSTPSKMSGSTRTWMEKAKAWVQGKDAAMIKIELIMNMLDGNNVDGFFHKAIWQPLVEAQGDFYDRQEKLAGQLKAAVDQMPKEQQNSMSDEFNVKGVDQKLNRRQIITMLLYYGTDASKTKLLGGWATHGLTEAGAMDAFRHLNQHDVEFVKGVWSAFESTWSDVAALQKKMSGVEPKKEEHVPFDIKLSDGSTAHMPGGYFPLKPARGESAIADRVAAAETSNIFDHRNGYTNATTSTGHTKNRTGAIYPVSLDYVPIINQHSTQMLMDLSHREAIMLASRILKNQTVKRAIKETLGEAYQEQLMPWLKYIVNHQNSGANDAGAAWHEWSTKSRSNVVASSIAFSYSSIIKHTMDIARIIGPGDYRVPVLKFGEAFAEFLAHPRQSLAEAGEMSAEMKHRFNHLDRDLRDNLRRLGDDSGWLAEWNRVGHKGLGALDQLLSIPAFFGSYRHSLDLQLKENPNADPKEAHDKAVQEAERTVRMVRMTGNAKDLLGVQRSPDGAVKLMTMFMGNGPSSYNIIRGAAHNMEGLHGLGSLTAAGVTMSLAGMLANYITGHGPKKNADEKEIARWATLHAMLAWAEPIPLVRDVAGPMVNVLEGHGMTDYRFSPIVSYYQKAIGLVQHTKRLSDGTEDPTEYAINVVDAIGTLGGVGGTAQFVKTAKYLHNRSTGKIQPPENAGEAITNNPLTAPPAKGGGK